MKLVSAFHLELRKHRNFFLQSLLLTALIFLVILFVFRIEADTIPIREIIEMELQMMLVGGFIFFPSMFGITTGRGLQKQPQLEIETLLPVSSGVRIASAFLAGLTYTLCLLIPLFLIQTISNFSVVLYRDYVSLTLTFVAGVLGFLHLQLIFFIAGYWRQHLLRSVLLIGALAGLEAFLVYGTICDRYGSNRLIGIVVLFLIPLLIVGTGLFLLNRISRDFE